MEFSGSTEINAPRDRVWAFVIDPQQVGWCGPGVESIEEVDATHFRARAKVGIGVISTRFNVNLELTEAEEPDRAVIKATGPGAGQRGRGHGGDAARGSRRRARRRWSGTAKVAILGTIAAVGSRLVEGTANKLIKQAFDCMRAKLEA